MRPSICSLRTSSVSEVRRVRSKGNSWRRTFSMMSTAILNAKSDSTTCRRIRLRVISICLARKISRSRLSNGIFPIWLRYIRIGSRDDSADVSAPRRARAAFSACSSRISSSIGSGSSGMSGSSIKSSPSSSIALIRLSTMAGSPPSSGSHS